MNNRLRQVRKLRGMTITQLHNVSGVSRGYISDIETGKRIPSANLAHRLAKALRTTLDMLFGDEQVTA